MGKTNAKQHIRRLLDSIDVDEKPRAWAWANALYMAVNEAATLNNYQVNLVDAVMGECHCHWRWSDKKISDDVFSIAAWINSCG